MWASSFKCSENDTTAFVELSVTTSIPDSWELPSYLAGDVLDMGRYRDDRDRFVVPDRSWQPGQDSKIHEVDFAGTHQMREQQKLPGWMRTWPDTTEAGREIEPYDPAKHRPMEPAEMYSQDSLDALRDSGFEPQDNGVWRREVLDEEGKPLGASHILTYEPGHRRPSDRSRAPWHLTTDPETAGIAFSTLRGHRGALSAADEDVAQARKMPKQARLYLSVVATFVGKTAAAQSPGRASADDWLDQNAHLYDEWS